MRAKSLKFFGYFWSWCRYQKGVKKRSQPHQSNTHAFETITNLGFSFMHQWSILQHKIFTHLHLSRRAGDQRPIRSSHHIALQQPLAYAYWLKGWAIGWAIGWALGWAKVEYFNLLKKSHYVRTFVSTYFINLHNRKEESLTFRQIPN